jgi:nucleotide-binding universal stress UspA family protein
MSVTDLVLIVVVATLAAIGGGLAARRWLGPRRLPARSGRRVLVPFSGRLDSTVLDAAIRIARADDATLVPAYLVIVPLEYDIDSALREQVQLAMPLLEAVERAALGAGVPVDGRIEKGRTLAHALRLLWEAERFDRVVAPAAGRGHPGFGTKDIAWLLENAPAETLVFKPYDEPTKQDDALSVPMSF